MKTFADDSRAFAKGVRDDKPDIAALQGRSKIDELIAALKGIGEDQHALELTAAKGLPGALCLDVPPAKRRCTE